MWLNHQEFWDVEALIYTCCFHSCFQGLWYEKDSSLWMLPSMNDDHLSYLNKLGILTLRDLLVLPDMKLQSLLRQSSASELYKVLLLSLVLLSWSGYYRIHEFVYYHMTEKCWGQYWRYYSQFHFHYYCISVVSEIQFCYFCSLYLCLVPS